MSPIENEEQQEIEQLIAAEDNPKDRLLLVIMNRINLSMAANTRSIENVATKLDAHLIRYTRHAKAEEALLNRGRGAWYVVLGVLGIAHLLVALLWTEYRATIADLRAEVRKQHDEAVRNDVKHTELTSKLIELERRERIEHGK